MMRCKDRGEDSGVFMYLCVAHLHSRMCMIPFLLYLLNIICRYRSSPLIVVLNASHICLTQSRGISDPSEVIFQMSKDERKDFYRTIAKGLQRPLFSVYRRVIRMYDEKNYVGKYRPEEISQLRE